MHSSTPSPFTLVSHREALRGKRRNENTKSGHYLQDQKVAVAEAEATETGSPLLHKMDMKHMKEYLSWLYYQYLLITCSYVLEPWEQNIFNTVLLTVIAMVIYTSYVFIPIHVRLALEFFSSICEVDNINSGNYQDDEGDSFSTDCLIGKYNTGTPDGGQELAFKIAVVVCT
ncbi:hypothetical protein NDU88_001139 [Pleurodeles waltl]|uniref:Serine palmitoyltransferase small subunit B n=1 Tax=Pleurodeles waltl TaxID=8319 RepID=A0AAV7LKJ3_PLEWA|nr:hypothetical protein NDU88_001139 [Pleurodeles waltl]